MPGEESLSLSTLPLETILDDILPNLPTQDLLNLAQCNKVSGRLAQSPLLADMIRSSLQLYATITPYGNTNWSTITISREKVQLEQLAGSSSIEGCIIQKVRETEAFCERLIIRNVG